MSERRKEEDGGMVTLCPQIFTQISCVALFVMTLPNTSISLPTSSYSIKYRSKKKGINEYSLK